jgi:hypothetical protein
VGLAEGLQAVKPAVHMARDYVRDSDGSYQNVEMLCGAIVPRLVADIARGLNSCTCLECVQAWASWRPVSPGDAMVSLQRLAELAEAAGEGDPV